MDDILLLGSKRGGIFWCWTLDICIFHATWLVCSMRSTRLFCCLKFVVLSSIVESQVSIRSMMNTISIYNCALIIFLFRDEKLSFPEEVHIHKEVCIFLKVIIVFHIQPLVAWTLLIEGGFRCLKHTTRHRHLWLRWIMSFSQNFIGVDVSVSVRCPLHNG